MMMMLHAYVNVLYSVLQTYEGNYSLAAVEQLIFTIHLLSPIHTADADTTYLSS